MPDGVHQFKCQAPLWKCLNYVDDVCKGASYEVLYARDDQRVFGSEQSSIEGHTSEAQVHCLGLHAKPLGPTESATQSPPPPSSSEPGTTPPPAVAPAPSASAPSSAAPSASVTGSPAVPLAPRALACVPGATQACVGSGACKGGQACRGDGSGFGPCDCGPATHAP